MLESVWRKWNPSTLLVGMQACATTIKSKWEKMYGNIWRVLRKLKIELPYGSAIPLLEINPYKTIVQKDICTPVFIAGLFPIAKTWKQPKCPWTDKWIKKMRCIYTMKYYSAIKNNEVIPLAATWIELEIIILGEVGQRNRKSLMWNLK